MTPACSNAPLIFAEISSYLRTSLHAEVVAFIKALREQLDQRLHLSTFGCTAQGRFLPLLVLSDRGHFTPKAAAQAELPIVLLICRGQGVSRLACAGC